MVCLTASDVAKGSRVPVESGVGRSFAVGRWWLAVGVGLLIWGLSW